MAMFLLILLYGVSSLPLSYIYSFMFTNYSTAQISIMAINFGTGFVSVLAILIMQSLPETQDAAKVMVHVFRVFPPYLIGEGFINLATTYYLNIYFQPQSFFAWQVTGRNLTFMGIEAVVYFGLVLLGESTLFRRVYNYLGRVRERMILTSSVRGQKAYEPDEDVLREKKKMEKADPKDYSLYVSNLEKVYPPAFLSASAKYAVRGVSFGCPDGERFGLLGINGAGKTTTMGMLTGDTEPTAGNLMVAGIPLSHPEFYQHIGYCPQVDPLLELMTAYETLFFFGRIRGISVDELNAKIDSLVDQVGLTAHAHRPCGTYSGGNKRKMSLAVALIGDPRVLLLDEPSTGMDPEARRSMWEVIEAVSEDRSIVLVSHSMEECEALCTRIGIMVSGRMQCLGTTQHIKSRFGAGYQIEVRVKEGGEGAGARGVDAVTKVLHAIIDPSALEINEKHGGYIRYSCDAEHLDLAGAFAALEGNKVSLGVLDYSISQSTLEQIFVKFAAEQEEEVGSRDIARGSPVAQEDEEQKSSD